VPSVRIATFNVENLFARFKFEAGVDEAQAVRDGWDVNKTFFTVFDEAAKKITGKAIQAADADVICLQEVENLDTLKRFRSDYLGGPKAYPYAVSVDGNDPRLIDVAVLSRLPIVHVRSYQQLRSGRSYVFSRDCLEVDVSVNGKTLTLFVNHLKSMLDQHDPKNGRRNTRARRELQARTVKEIVTDRFGARASRKPWIVLGDFNDYLETDEAGGSGIAELVEWNAVENVVDRLPQEERWTHYFRTKSAPQPGSYHQLDYLLPSRALAQNSSAAPTIIRNGLARRADRYQGRRFPGVGVDSPVASDHCPVVWSLTL
jgi:endonuclease/exonuclease/phosphatase family metal-dependent hydrolase